MIGDSRPWMFRPYDGPVYVGEDDPPGDEPELVDEEYDEGPGR